MSTTIDSEQGDHLRVAERLIVTTEAGVFRPLAPDTLTADGDLVREGQAVGTVEGPGRSIEVRSFFTGHLMGMLVEPGERVRPGQPVAWLRSTPDDNERTGE